MIRDELTEILRELTASAGARRAWVVRADPGPDAGGDDDVEVARAPLGGGAFVVAEFPPAPSPRTGEDRRAWLERAARALRAAGRRWQADPLPEVRFPPASPRTDPRRIRERIGVFLQAFANATGMIQALVTVRGVPVATALPLEEAHRDRLPFLVRRVNAEASRRTDSSHATVVGDDVFATSFWFGAHLVAFFDGPWAEDFVRHRARLVTREVAVLLPELEPPPEGPASIAPIPE